MNEKNYKRLILKSAGEIINQQGIKKLTVANIVRMSKISNRNFYECFSSKEELLEELRNLFNEQGMQIPDERQLLLEKAAEMIAQSGFNNITLETIANFAGIKRGLVYKYFSDKYELLECCVEYFSERIKGITKKLYEENEDNPEEFIKKYMENMVFFINRSSDSTMHTEVWGHVGYRYRIRKLTLSIQECFREHMIKCLKNGIDQGIFKKDLNLESVTDFMLFTFNGMSFFLKKEATEDRISKESAELILNTIYQMIRIENRE